jgi:uncharacterized protein (TIGR03067 family)
MRRCVPACLALLFLLSGASPRIEGEEAARKERKALEGAWDLIEAVVRGKKAHAARESGIVLIFEDDRFSMRPRDTGEEGTYKVGTGKGTKTIDITPTSGFGRGHTALGIYELKGDSLRACFAPPGSARPTKLESRAGTGTILATYKRRKP